MNYRTIVYAAGAALCFMGFDYLANLTIREISHTNSLAREGSKWEQATISETEKVPDGKPVNRP